MNHVTEKKLNNKGFSLVELIIVIAIMAVLIGVLAPQYLRYVERSRVSTDLDNVDAIVSALQIWGADPDAGTQFVDGDDIQITDTAAAVPATGTAIGDALANAGITGNLQLENRQTFDEVTITVTVAAGGVITVDTVYELGGTVVTP